MSVSPSVASGESSPQLSTALEAEAVQLFVSFGLALGLPRSYGSIFGYLFVSRAPKSLEDVVQALGLSKGSVSQGLRALRTLRAVQPVYPAGERRVHYVPELSLRRLASGFLRERLEPDLEDGQQRLVQLRERLEYEPDAAIDPEHLRECVERIDGWQRKARRVLPLVRRAVG